MHNAWTDLTPSALQPYGMPVRLMEKNSGVLPTVGAALKSFWAQFKLHGCEITLERIKTSFILKRLECCLFTICASFRGNNEQAKSD